MQNLFQSQLFVKRKRVKYACCLSYLKKKKYDLIDVNKVLEKSLEKQKIASLILTSCTNSYTVIIVPEKQL